MTRASHGVSRPPRAGRKAVNARSALSLLLCVAAAAGAMTAGAARAADRLDASGLAQAADKAAPEIPFSFDGESYVKTEAGEIVPLLDVGPDVTVAPDPKVPHLASGTAANWPDRFSRDLLSAQDVAAIKGTAATRPARYNLIPWQTPIKNQGGRGTCYAFAFMAGLEAAYRHKYGRLVDGKYVGPDWVLSEEYLIHITKSTLLNRPQTYQFENPSSFWEGVLGVTGYPMMISVLSEQMMNYRVAEAQFAPYLKANNPAPASPPGLLQIADASCPAVGALVRKWSGAPPQFNAARQCISGNCATQREVDACEYSPSHLPAAAAQNARFGIAFAYRAADGRVEPGARTLTAQQSQDTDLLESLLYQGREVVGEFYLKWKRGPQIQAPFQTSPLWEYDAGAHGDGHNMLIIGYDRTDPSPSRWYFVLKNSWGGNKYFLVSYEFIRHALRGSVVIMDVVNPGLDKPVSLARGGGWLGIWPVHRGAKNDLDGNLVIRRTFDPNVMIQPKAGTDLRLGEYFPASGAPPREVLGHLTADRTMIFHIAGAGAYAWAFGGQPLRNGQN